MFDVKWIRDNPDSFDSGLARRGIAPKAAVLVDLDQRRRTLIASTQELQEQRIQSIYPENYQDHLKNRTHASERNSFQWLNGGPDLIIDSSQDREDIQKLIHSFIQ